MEPNMQSPQPPVTGAPQTPPPAPTPAPTPTPVPPVMPPAPRSHLGTILGVVIVIVALVLGGLYLWGASLSDEQMQEEVAAPMTTEETTPIPPSPPDEIDTIEAELNMTDVNSLDQELNTIDSEIGAEAQAQ